jgi:large subunit ribosomal protein L23
MNQERLYQVILSPHISEKTSVAMEKRNEYAFQVVDTATKSEVKDAIEFLFNTKVKSVRVVNVRAKQKMFRGFEGKRKSWKKAYVTLQADQKLDIVGAQ